MSQDVLTYLAFFALAGLTLLAALAVVALKNLLHSALALVVTFLGVAGIYFLLQAEFIAVVQVLIYIGAITVLIVFAIMLTRRLMQQTLYQFTAKWWLAAPLALLLFAGLAFTLFGAKWLERPKEALPADTVATLGSQLMTTYALPFEIASVLLLVALVGAIVVAWPGRDRLPAVEEMERKVHEAEQRAESAEEAGSGAESQSTFER